MENISFTLKTEEVGKVAISKNVVTNADGTVIDTVDTFVDSNTNRVVQYTIS